MNKSIIQSGNDNQVNAGRVSPVESFYTEHRLSLFLISIVIIAIIAWLDYVSSYELNISMLYLIPIALNSWFGERWQGLGIVGIAVLSTIIDDLISLHIYESLLVPIWNLAFRCFTFLLVSWLMIQLHKGLQNEQRLARTDPLTGAANSRAFYESLESEIERSRRYQHPISLVYLDVDNFKQVNDSFGHQAGDDLLCLIVEIIKAHIRPIDYLARLGGDEFAILLVETENSGALITVKRLKDAIINALPEKLGFVSVSYGIITCQTTDTCADDMIQRADDLMYQAKAKLKGSIAQDNLVG
jgi:diguanylate cyclase (GGDEF)-like protein